MEEISEKQIVSESEKIFNAAKIQVGDSCYVTWKGARISLHNGKSFWKKPGHAKNALINMLEQKSFIADSSSRGGVRRLTSKEAKQALKILLETGVLRIEQS